MVCLAHGRQVSLLALALTLAGAGCDGCADRPIPASPRSDGGGAGDATAGLEDGGPSDTSLVDTGELDGGSEDALFYFDASASNDASTNPFDAWTIDAAGNDASITEDATAPPPDAATPDASSPPPDAGLPGTGDIWVEIDYSNASTPPSPSWRFSNTPGWGSAEWAAVNATRPEAWDRWNNMSVVNDPIGRSLEIGSSSELQLMIGLEELISYTSATVRVEGRSRSTSASVDFNVYNPWNGCGTTARFSNDWSVHVVDLDLAQCFEIGQGVQAVRIEPTNGTVALVRMRLTLHGARW